MTEQEERNFEKYEESYFKSHRDAPSGRNFLAFVERFHSEKVQRNYDIGICRTFPQAPGSFMCDACRWVDCELRREL
jgi:hypothetical protein